MDIQVEGRPFNKKIYTLQMFVKYVKLELVFVFHDHVMIAFFIT